MEGESSLGNVEEFLRECLQGMEPDCRQRSAGRPRVLPATALWAGLLVCVLQGFHSQLALWRMLSQKQLWFYPRFPVTDQAVYNRLQRGGTNALEGIFAEVSRVLSHRLAQWTPPEYAPFAAQVVCIDESTLDQVARKLADLRDLPKGDLRLIPGKLSGLFDLRTQQWRKVRFQPRAQQNEKVLARELVAELPLGSLVVADLGYFGFAWFDWLTEGGYFWLSRLRQKTSYQVIHTYYSRGETFDGIIWLGAYRADRAKYAVRLVTFRQGNTLHRYITNVHDPHTFPMAAMARVYAQRWDIELAFKMLKRYLKLHLLWSAKPVVIQQQIWATLIIAQTLQRLRLEIAYRAGVDPNEVSMPLLVEYAPIYAYEGQDPVAVFVNQGRELRFIRPSRRTQVTAPVLSEDDLSPLPPDLTLVRTPRYAQRKASRT
ncbi:MAG: IS4 family transposase [Chloroflexota bacterium]|nr:IS4 family transposase [Chloroflexota bacterium]